MFENVSFTPPSNHSLHEMFEYSKDGTLVLQPSYQRKYIYSNEAAQSVVKSVLKGIGIGGGIVNIIKDATGENEKWEVIDGQQRLTSLIRFYDGEFAIGSGKEKKYFKDLSPSDKKKITTYQFSISKYEGLTQDEVIELFRLANKGKAMSKSEARHALCNGKLAEATIKIISSDAFKKTFSNIIRMKKDSRFECEEFVWRLYYARHGIDGTVDFPESYTDLKKYTDSQLNAFVRKEWSDPEIEKFKTELNRLFKFTKDYFKPEILQPKQNRNGYYWRFLGISLVLEKTSHTQRISSGMIENLEKDICELRCLRGNEISDGREYKEKRCHNFHELDNKYAFELYNKIMSKYFLCSNNTGRREFSKSQKKAKWEESLLHICPICKTEIKDISDAEADHIIPFAKGGKTELENMQLVHALCNRAKGTSSEFNNQEFNK